MEFTFNFQGTTLTDFFNDNQVKIINKNSFG